MSMTINVTHANLKTPVAIMKSAVFAVYASSANKATHIVSIGGSFLPVLESKEDIVAALNTEDKPIINNEIKEPKNVKRTSKKQRHNDSVSVNNPG